MPTDTPLTEAEIAALEEEVEDDDDAGLDEITLSIAEARALLAEVRAAREAAKRHDLEARRRIAELESMLGPRS
jgi:transcription elongation GreA/GreB family factor